jgi:hypothetical protein
MLEIQPTIEGRQVMKKILGVMFVCVLLLAAGPAFAGGEVVQMWKCEMDDDASEAQVMEGAQKWLAAAKKIKGAENLEAYVYFPVAVNATGEMDAMFVVQAPTFKEWAALWDGYEGSEAAKVENANNELVVCPDSVLWESMKVE